MMIYAAEPHLLFCPFTNNTKGSSPAGVKQRISRVAPFGCWIRLPTQRRRRLLFNQEKEHHSKKRNSKLVSNNIMGCGATRDVGSRRTSDTTGVVASTVPVLLVPDLLGAGDDEHTLGSQTPSTKSFHGVGARSTPRSQRSGERSHDSHLIGMATAAPPSAPTPTSSSLGAERTRKTPETAIGRSLLTTALTKISSTRSHPRAASPTNSQIIAAAQPHTLQAFDDDDGEESASRDNFDEDMGTGDCFDDAASEVGEKPKLAMFRQDVCGACSERPIEYNCKQCLFGLCEDCFFSGNTGGHNDLHEMEALNADRHCGGSRSGFDTGLLSGGGAAMFVTFPFRS
ncbi:zinc finger protein, putative [Bodo saltans]|uniref:Zinc finger protein, putative n=1 Tax=Bodo saltans TaxID=75058 RepID=A0A0S4JLT0_BODSA|nr:zinc finger protein, putative [Bodo saltans]|eukprot:CUG91146.1 zinc finger protein, putative [Bodo saltans]